MSFKIPVLEELAAIRWRRSIGVKNFIVGVSATQLMYIHIYSYNTMSKRLLFLLETAMCIRYDARFLFARSEVAITSTNVRQYQKRYRDTVRTSAEKNCRVSQ